ncbi:hypothetical protein M408DRAFT_29454 [Serendipita vermifera MAFF 305830]|uniref:Kinesin-like domain-containing protein n=1 Tax=Serendipita vermifera MAFF 305830 TaxID=933852 RepID=A0A0C2WW64_SERVB|nr:hypothetical protein M408DRAFT_29454 [Serendipita vermifera MAFF 305830]
MLIVSKPGQILMHTKASPAENASQMGNPPQSTFPPLPTTLLSPAPTYLLNFSIDPDATCGLPTYHLGRLWVAHVFPPNISSGESSTTHALKASTVMNTGGTRPSFTSTVPIFCRYTAEAIGSCRVDIKIASVTPPPKSRNGSNTSTTASSPIRTTIQPGSKVNFFLSVDQMKGLESNDFSSIHLQIRLASITGPIDLTSAGSSELKFKRTFQLIATPKILAYLREGHAPIEFFASLQATYLERMERWDEMREQHNIRAKPNGSAPTNSNPNLPTMRRSENDFVVEEVHDVVSCLSICELGSDGKYNPVPVLSQSPLDPGSFSLRQGLQRRLRLTLSSNSGKELP